MSFVNTQLQEKAAAEQDPDHDADYRKAARRRWARLIKKVYEVDPLICPECGGAMEIISFITENETIRKILDHVGEAHAPPQSPAPKAAVVASSRPIKPISIPANALPWSEGQSYPEEWFS